MSYTIEEALNTADTINKNTFSIEDALTQADEINASQEQEDFENIGYAGRRFIGSMFLDDDMETEFYAARRFPDEDRPSDRYVNINGILYYTDDDGNLKKEFPDAESYFFADTVFPNIAPTFTFGADVAGGLFGAQKAFNVGSKLAQGIPNPVLKYLTKGLLTGAGGFAGNLASGLLARSMREAVISSYYEVPPEELVTAFNDTINSSLFSLLPFGHGTTRELIKKFKGKETLLGDLVKIKKDAAAKVADAEAAGVPLTFAEAGVLGNKAQAIQRFLAAQPMVEKFNNFYSDRSSRIKETLEVFADKIGGKGTAFGGTEAQLAKTMNEVTDELAKRRITRADKIYNQLNDAGYIKVDGVESIVKSIDDYVAKLKEPSPKTIKNMEKFKKFFYNEQGELVDDLMSLNQRRAVDMNELAQKLKGKGSGDAKQMFKLMKDLGILMDDAEPLYQLARRIYDPTKPALQLVEKSVIGKYAKLVKDKQTARALKEVFDPNTTERSLRNTKRILQAVNPDLYNMAKRDFLLSQLSHFTKQGALEKGLPSFQKHFAQPNQQKLLQVMFEPAEYDEFMKMNSYIGDAFSINRGFSTTQPFQALEEKILAEVPRNNPAQNFLEPYFATMRFVRNAISGHLGDDFTKSIALKQNEAYMDKMADFILGGGKADDLFSPFSSYNFSVIQSGARGAEALEDKISQPEEINYQEKNLLENNLQGLQNSIPNISPQINVPIFDVPEDDTKTLSPSILPNEKDREIALRDMSSGIGSLA